MSQPSLRHKLSRKGNNMENFTETVIRRISENSERAKHERTQVWDSWRASPEGIWCILQCSDFGIAPPERTRAELLRTITFKVNNGVGI